MHLIFGNFTEIYATVYPVLGYSKGHGNDPCNLRALKLQYRFPGKYSLTLSCKDIFTMSNQSFNLLNNLKSYTMKKNSISNVHWKNAYFIFTTGKRIQNVYSGGNRDFFVTLIVEYVKLVAVRYEIKLKKLPSM